MKSLVTFLLLWSFATSASAQGAVHPFSKGTKLVGFNAMGGSSRTTTDGRDGETTAALLNGQFGYFVIDGLVLGIDVDMTVGSMEEENGFGGFSLEMKQSTIGLYSAYYFALSPKSAVYPELRLFKGTEEFAVDLSFLGSSDESTELSGATIGLGFINRFHQNVGLDFKIRVGSQKSQVNNSINRTTLDWSRAEFLVGFQIIL